MIGSSVRSMNFMIFLVLVLVLVLELVLDDGVTVTLVVVYELIELYSVIRDDLLEKSMGTDCDLLLLCLLRPYFPSSNQVRAIISMNL